MSRYYYNEKGKFFTDVITKDAVPSTIQTIMHRIRGNVYVRPNERLKDELENTKKFLAITDAKVYDLRGNLLYSSKFITVNLDHIIWLLPDEEVITDDKDNEPGK